MPKPGREQKQFNIKVTGESEILTIEAAQKYCADNKIAVSDFVISALRKALDSGLIPPDDSEVLNQRFNELTSKVNAIESTLESLTKELAILKSRKQPSKKPKVKSSTDPDIRTIGYLKSYNVLPKGFVPMPTDIDKVFDGIDGSRWRYLGVHKSTLAKQFQRLP
jgi:hypothetical protein